METPGRPEPEWSSPALYRDDQHKAELEARNGLRQFDEVRRLVQEWDGVLRFHPDVVKSLHQIAIQDVYACAGNYRTGSVIIGGTIHEPPPHEEVPEHVEEMCSYANSVGNQPIHVASYLMWRLNWIHPFFGGNGRTSRAVSYLGLSVALHMEIPGVITIPDMIVNNRAPYYAALDAGDAAWARGQLDVSAMEDLMSAMLAEQLKTAI